MATITAIAPLAAPLPGQFFSRLSRLARGVFVTLLLYGLIMLGVAWFWLPESSPRKARRIRSHQAFTAYGALMIDPFAVGLLLASGMGFTSMFAYITAGPFYFMTVWNFSPFAYASLFAVNGVGIIDEHAEFASRHSYRTGESRELWQRDRLRRGALPFDRGLFFTCLVRGGREPVLSSA